MQNQPNINLKIGIFTYDYFHLKTEQVLANLIRKGFLHQYQDIIH